MVAVGDKAIKVPSRGGDLVVTLGNVSVGDKVIPIPDAMGRKIVAKLTQVSPGDKAIIVPDGKGQYIVVKGGVGETAGVAVLLAGEADYGHVFALDTSLPDGIFPDLFWIDNYSNVRNGTGGVPVFFVNGNIVVVGSTRGEIWRTLNRGMDWSFVQDLGGTTNGFTCMTGRPDGTILAGATVGGTPTLYRSTNNGQSWGSVATFGGEPDIEFIIDCGGTTWMLGFQKHYKNSPMVLSKHIYRSTNNGLNWSLCLTMGYDPVGAMAYCGNGIIVAGTYNQSYYPQIWSTLDYGDNWVFRQQFITDNPLGLKIEAIIPNDAGQGIIMSLNNFADQGYIYHSTDGSITWHSHGAIGGFSDMKKNPTGVVFGMKPSAGQISYSNNYGGSFTPISSYEYYPGSSYMKTNNIVYMPSRVRSGRWRKLGNPLPNMYTYSSVYPKVYNTGGGTWWLILYTSSQQWKNYRTTNNGMSWTDVSPGYFAYGLPSDAWYYSGAVTNIAGRIVAFYSYVYGGSYYGWIKRSVNGGQTWATTWTANGGTLEAIVDCGSCILAFVKGSYPYPTGDYYDKILRSDDDGVTWQISKEGSGCFYGGNLYYDAGRLYAAAKYSDNLGQVWNSYVSGAPAQHGFQAINNYLLTRHSDQFNQPGGFVKATGTGGSPPNLGKTWDAATRIMYPSFVECGYTGIEQYGASLFLASTNGNRATTFLSTDGMATWQPHGNLVEPWNAGIMETMHITDSIVRAICRDGSIWEYTQP